MKREGISTLFIHGFPWAHSTCSSFKIACAFVLKSFVLLRFNPCISPQECYEVFLKTLSEKCLV